MKKQEKIALIQSAINELAICRCYFVYDDNYFYYYSIMVNDKFLLGVNENDFSLNGYSIRKMSHLNKVEIKDDKCHEINKMFGIVDQIINPNIDISSWQSIFQSLINYDGYIIVQDEFHQKFFIGKLIKVFKNKFDFLCLDADGNWYDYITSFRYTQITSISWNTRYDIFWKKYMESK